MKSYVFNKVRVRTDTSIHVRIMPSQFQTLLSPLGGICRAFVILSVPAVGNLSENHCPGMKHLSILLEEVKVVPFSLKNMNIQIVSAISINNIFNTVLCFKKICLHHFPTPQYVLHLSHHRDQFAYGWKTINVSFEVFKGEILSLCRKCFK